MDQLTQRNFHTLSDGLKSVRDEIMTMKEDNKRKDGIIAQQNIRIDTMQQQVSILFAKSMGSGSTS